MSSLNRSISNTEVIPYLETDVFQNNPEAQFAVGIIAHGDEVIPGRENEYNAYLKLRKNVYVDQTRMLAPEDLDENGTDVDIDDQRSVHFAVIENAMQQPRLVASMRIIVKSKEDERVLPIEEFFPEAFDEPAPVDSSEVSRYICRHEDRRTEALLKWPLFTAAVSYLIGNGLRPTYAVVEDFLERSLQKQVPLKRIADPKYVAAYSADNMGIEIDVKQLAQMMCLSPEQIEELRVNQEQFTYFGERPDQNDQSMAV